MLPVLGFAVTGEILVFFTVLFLERFEFPPAFGGFLVLFGFSVLLLCVSFRFVLDGLVDLFDIAILNDPLIPRPFTCFIKPFLIPALRASFKCLLVECFS